MTGSIKDRLALCILRKAYEEAKIQPGDTTAEATNGNTGISFAALGSALGYRVLIFMPDWMSKERTELHDQQDVSINSLQRIEKALETTAPHRANQ